MALTAGTVFSVQSGATTGNVNGSGFNPASAGFFTDLVGSTANTSSPSVTSASYTFVAGDFGNWVYIKSGTNWTPGWYQIASVGAGAATLSAAIGAAILTISSTGVVTYNTLAGCATTASPTAGTYGVDYSQTTAATATSSTATSSGAGSIILFAGATASMVGNFVHVISGTNFTVGWYEITAATAGVSITTDRASTTGNGATGVINVGGAGNLNGLEDAYQAMLPIGAQVFVQNGSYALSAAISTASSNGTSVSSIYWTGYNSVRGDVCTGANRPTIVAGANAVTLSTYHFFQNFSFTITTAGGVTTRTGTQFYNCKFQNTSTTTTRVAVSLSGNYSNLTNCEVISQNGVAVTASSAVTSCIIGCYIHDSSTGISDTVGPNDIIIGNIFEYCNNIAINLGSSNIGDNIIQGNTIYGRESKNGTGISLAVNNPNNIIANNILYGLTTGISVSTGSSTSNSSQNNDFFNNTTDVTNWVKSPTDLAVDPTFTSVSQVTGTVGQGLAGSLFQDTTKNFTTLGVVANRDFVRILSGGSLTTGCYLITAITTTTNPNDTLTLNNNAGTGAATGVYTIPIGHNFQIGTNLKGAGFPSFVNATNGLTTSYPDVGAVQRQEPSGGTSGGSFTFVG